MRKKIFIGLALALFIIIPLTVTNYFYQDKKKIKMIRILLL